VSGVEDRKRETCPASGSAPNFTRFDEVTRTYFIGCSFCDREFPEADLIPEHLILALGPGA
jgi:hypothetical protein